LPKPLIFTVSAAWDEESKVWKGTAEAIPASAEAATLDEVLTKISAIALEVLPANYPDVHPGSVYLQLNVLKGAEPPKA